MFYLKSEWRKEAKRVMQQAIGELKGPRESFDALHFCMKKAGIFRNLNASVDNERNDSIISSFETT
jgi:hypothetical protein